MLARNMFELLKQVGIDCARDEQDAVIELIKECDLNGDGFISFQEFLYILRRFAHIEYQKDLIVVREYSQQFPDLVSDEFFYLMDEADPRDAFEWDQLQLLAVLKKFGKVNTDTRMLLNDMSCSCSPC
jgi:hypothetical protein